MKMKTQILKINPQKPEADKIAYAAQVLREGGTVAFPTETVYGLGADALNETAVRKIFEAKGRPADNPLIVHVSSISAVDKLVDEIPEAAKQLMDAYWPGPLTVVMQKKSRVPDIITAGLNTVAVRMPSHPIAYRLIEAAGIPVAAPSANISGKPSPTVGQHVIDDLLGRVDMIIDGGSAQVGLESTVIDVTGEKPLLLRPGGITHTQLKRLLGAVDIDAGVTEKLKKNIVPRSPGMKYSHYSPKAEVIVVEGKRKNVIARINRLAQENQKRGLKVGVLAMSDTIALYNADRVLTAGDENRPETVAANLFYCLRAFDAAGVDIIYAQSVADREIGMAIRNRLHKAAGYHIISADG